MAGLEVVDKNELAVWQWLETLSHRQNDELCNICGATVSGLSEARCWRCVAKGLPAQSKPVWVMTLFCCPTCGEPAELGVPVCVACSQPIVWDLPVKELLRRAGVDLESGSVADALEHLRSGRVRSVAPPALPVAVVHLPPDGELKPSD